MTNADTVTPSASSNSSSPWPFAGSLALVLVLAGFLRGYQVNEPLWVDELHTAWCVNGTFADVASRARIGNQSPLPFYLTWLSVKCWGLNECALRLLPLLASLGYIAVVGYAVYRSTQETLLAVLAASLATVDRHFIFYGQEARPYSMVQLLAVVHLLTTIRVWRAPSLGNRAAHWGTAVALFHLHYTTALLLAGEIAAWAWCRTRRQSCYSLAAATLDSILIGLACLLPTWQHLALISDRRQNWQAFVTTDLSTSVEESAMVYFVVPLGCGAVVYLLLRLLRLRPQEAANTNTNTNTKTNHIKPTASPEPQTTSTGTMPGSEATLVLLGSLIAIPVALSWLLTAREVAAIFHYRYLLGSVALAPVAAACFASRWSPRWGAQVALAAALVTSLLYGQLFPTFLYHQRFTMDRQEGWRDAIGHLNQQNAEHPRPVFVFSGLIECSACEEQSPLRSYCCLPVTSIYQAQIPAENWLQPYDGNAVISEASKRRVYEQQGAFLIVRLGADADRLAERWQRELVAEGKCDKASYGGVQVYRLYWPSPDP